jgi:hypothetical protein
VSTLADDAGTLDAHAENLAVAGYQNIADELQVIARNLRKWDGLLSAIYDETLQEIAEVETRIGARRTAIMTGDVTPLRRRRG